VQQLLKYSAKWFFFPGKICLISGLVVPNGRQVFSQHFDLRKIGDVDQAMLAQRSALDLPRAQADWKSLVASDKLVSVSSDQSI
jgi:hypothetical protein